MCSTYYDDGYARRAETGIEALLNLHCKDQTETLPTLRDRLDVILRETTDVERTLNQVVRNSQLLSWMKGEKRGGGHF